jgi:ribosomal protein S18 acetylase RimI-like enzyme
MRAILSIIATILMTPIALVCGLLTWNSNRKTLSIRKLGSRDAFWMLQLRNANAKYFGNDSQVSAEDHIAWFTKNYMKDENTWLVAMVGSKRAGYIRIENGVLSYCVDKKYRRRGVASMMLRHALHLNQRLEAKVLLSNVASRKLLKKHGFKLTGESYNFAYYCRL